MPLPTLRPMQINQPQPMNAFIAGQQAVMHKERQNWLRAEEGRAQETLELKKEAQRFQKVAQGVLAASKMKDPELAAKAYEAVTKEKASFSWEGSNRKIVFDDGSEISGPWLHMEDFLEYVRNHSEEFVGAMSDEKQRKMIDQAMKMTGLSIQFGGGGEKKGSDFEKALKEHRRNVGPISSANFRQNHWLKQGQDPYERIEYSQYSEQYRQIQRELRKLRTDPRLSFEGDNLMKDSIREQIKDLEAEAAEKKALMDSLIPPKARKPLMKKLSDHDAQRFYFDAADELGKEATHEEIKKRARENARRKNYRGD